MAQITTLTLFSYDRFRERLWAFGMMQFAKPALGKTEGLEFYKLLGVGKKHFDPRPDWSSYGLLQVWKDEAHAKAFFGSSSLMRRYRKHSTEQLTIFMRNIRARGLWSGQNPFVASKEIDADRGEVAVITRATIKTSKLKTFWDYVPTSQRDTQNNPDLLFTVGVGERPLTQMVTFSIWKNEEALKQFAYKQQNHRNAVLKTQALQWYKEELFSRFQPYRVEGSWKGFPGSDLEKI